MSINLWLFYAIGYGIAMVVQIWANKKRGEPFEDPELLMSNKILFLIAIIWLFGGFIICLFVPVNFGLQFYIGSIFCIIGLIIVLATFYSFAQKPGLATAIIHRYSRNPNYIGWIIFYFGLFLIGWSLSIWSIIFFIYFLITIPYLHWCVLIEEKFLSNKYGDAYKDYLKKTPRYIGRPRKSVPLSALNSKK
jgi:protein-S-isoprenylcysteine O-methyltransferase Ste14